MTTADVLIVAREEYDKGAINDQGFKSAVNGILDAFLNTMNDGEKVAAFNRIANFVRNNYRIDELDGGVQYIKSDLHDYFFEEAIRAVMGDNFFDFYNTTYESS